MLQCDKNHPNKLISHSDVYVSISQVWKFIHSIWCCLANGAKCEKCDVWRKDVLGKTNLFICLFIFTPNNKKKDEEKNRINIQCSHATFMPDAFRMRRFVEQFQWNETKSDATGQIIK